MPSKLYALLRRFASTLRPGNRDADLDDELHAHIDLATQANLSRGLNLRQARTEALRSFGGLTQAREAYRMQRGLPWLETLFQDHGYAVRRLAKSPGFTATVLLTLALGVGAVTCVFSVVNGVLLAPYAFRDPDRIVFWRENVREMNRIAPLLPDNYRHYLNLKAHASSIEDAAILQNPVFSVSGGDSADALMHPQMLEGLSVSPGFFSVLGVEPMLGRAFTPEEAQPGKDKELILTWAAWQRLFHGDPLVLGKTLRVGDVPQTIVGVLPRSFRFPTVSMMPGQVTHGSTERYELFKPMAPTENDLMENEGDFNYLVIARLKPGVSLQQAQTELDGIEKATAVADHLTIHPGVTVEPLAQEITGNVKQPLWLLLAAVSGLLLMACVNLANLQIARGVAREHETALCAALGAGRSRLLQSVLLENLLLGIAGGIGGIVLAFGGESLLVHFASSLPRMNEVHLNAPVLALSFAISVGASLAFGMMPAVRSLQVTPQSALQSASSRVAGNSQAARLRRLLVVTEVACSITLLIVTALVARSFARVLTQERHFNAQQVTLARTDLSAPRYSSGESIPERFGADPGSLERSRMITRTLDLLHSLPGAQSVAMVNVLPLSGDMSTDRVVRPDHPLPTSETPLADRRVVSPGYFSVMQISLLAGRDFSQQDREHPSVVIVSQKAAHDAFPGEDALGHTIEHWGRTYTIVGIAADARINDLKRNTAIFYLPYWDFPPYNPVFAMRGSANGQIDGNTGAAMRQAIWNIDSAVSIPTVTTFDEQVNESVATERFQSILLSSFGVTGLLLAALGIYGVLAYSVSQRTQEFGIRIALGSSRMGLMQTVFADAAYPVLAGTVIGLVGAAAAARWVRSQLYETSALDPLAIGLSLAVLFTAVLLAALLPLRTATSVDPMRALRSE